MTEKKNIVVHFLSLCILCAGFILCRYVFFEIHGMKHLPIWLFISGIFAVAISFFYKCRIVPVCTAIAYTAGFVFGVFFQSHGIDAGGGATNNLWIIWGLSFTGITMAGIIGENFISR